MMLSDFIAMRQWLWQMWLKHGPHLLCKEARRQEAIRLAEIERIENEVKKHELFLTLKGLQITVFTHNPKYHHRNRKWYAYVEGGGYLLTSYQAGISETDAKYSAIQRYYQKYGPKEN